MQDYIIIQVALATLLAAQQEPDNSLTPAISIPTEENWHAVVPLPDVPCISCKTLKV